MKEIVVKMDDKLYEQIFSDAEVMIYKGMRSGKTLLATLLRAIRNGIVLPKGHGRLIDADAVDTKYSDPEVVETLNDAPTIMEADKEEK